MSINGQTSSQNVTDSDGGFSIALSPGTYTITFSAPNYSDAELKDLVVKAGETTEASTVMSNKDLVTTVDVVEKADAVGATAEAMLQERKLSAVVSDSIGREELATGTSSDAAGALEKVTGVSVVGDGFVYVRGLGERYSATQLNGAVVPTTEPEKRVVPLDLFPTGLIENIKIAKTYSPDLPAEFSGGLVQMQTIEFPTQKVFNLSIKTGFNTATTFNPFLTYPGGARRLLRLRRRARAACPSIIPRDARLFAGQFHASSSCRPSAGPSPTTGSRPPVDSARPAWTGRRSAAAPSAASASWAPSASPTSRNCRANCSAISGRAPARPIIFTDYPDYREYTEIGAPGRGVQCRHPADPEQQDSSSATPSRTTPKRSAREFAGYDGGVDNDLAGRSACATSSARCSPPAWRATTRLPAGTTACSTGSSPIRSPTRDEPDLREVFRNLLPDGRYIFAGTSTSGLRFFSNLDDQIYEPQADYSIPFFKGSISGLFKTGFRATVRRRDFEARRFLFQPQRITTLDLFLPSNQLFAPDNIRPDGFQIDRIHARHRHLQRRR